MANILPDNKQKGIRDYFTIETSKAFLLDIDQALRTLNLTRIAGVFENYKIDHLEDSKDFVAQLNRILKKQTKKGIEIISCNNTEPRLSKCIACRFGHTVKVYAFEYKKQLFPNLEKTNKSAVIYRKEFGVTYTIKNNSIVDFGVCNTFLSKDDCDVL